MIAVDAGRCLACRSCQVACAIGRDAVNKGTVSVFAEAPVPIPRVRMGGGLPVVALEGMVGGGLPVQCRQCQQAPCVDACPTGALSARGGLVLLDAGRCIGCFMCVSACPLGAIRPGHAALVYKCDGCTGMEQPFCVEACPTGALRRGEGEEDQLRPARGDVFTAVLERLLGG